VFADAKLGEAVRRGGGPSGPCGWPSCAWTTTPRSPQHGGDREAAGVDGAVAKGLLGEMAEGAGEAPEEEVVEIGGAMGVTGEGGQDGDEEPLTAERARL